MILIKKLGFQQLWFSEYRWKFKMPSISLFSKLPVRISLWADLQKFNWPMVDVSTLVNQKLPLCFFNYNQFLYKKTDIFHWIFGNLLVTDHSSFFRGFKPLLNHHSEAHQQNYQSCNNELMNKVNASWNVFVSNSGDIYY